MNRRRNDGTPERQPRSRPATSPANARRTENLLVSPRRPRRGGGSDKTVANIDRLARKREERRKSAEEFKSKREAEIRDNEKKGKPGDVDFQRMIKLFRRDELPSAERHRDTGDFRVNVVVRKRPVSTREVKIKDYDSVSER